MRTKPISWIKPEFIAPVNRILYRYAYYLTMHLPDIDVDDLVQETWAKAGHWCGSYTSPWAAAWSLKTVMAKIIASEIRKRKRLLMMTFTDYQELMRMSDEQKDTQLRNGLFAQQRKDFSAYELAEYLRGLTDVERRVLINRLWGNNKGITLARLSGVTRQNISGRLRDALRKIRKRLDEVDK